MWHGGGGGTERGRGVETEREGVEMERGKKGEREERGREKKREKERGEEERGQNFICKAINS